MTQLGASDSDEPQQQQAQSEKAKEPMIPLDIRLAKGVPSQDLLDSKRPWSQQGDVGNIEP